MLKAEDIKKVGIGGAGTMGSSMAQIFAECGYDVKIYTRRQETLDKAKASIRSALDTKVEAGDTTKEKADAAYARIEFAPAGDLTALADSDLIVENVAENMDVKHKFWAEISALVSPDAILTTNTSGLSITKIAEAVVGPERFCGFHWFNPPHIIPLIEVINGDKTDTAVNDEVYKLAEMIGKKPIHVNKDALGFIGNRIQQAILREGLHIYQEGIGDFSDIDRCMKYGLGFRYACLGPFEIYDQGGVDIHYHIAEYTFPDLGDDKDPSKTYIGELMRNGYLGVKSGRGFYDYSNGKDKIAIKARDDMYLALAKANITAIGDKAEEEMKKLDEK